MRIAVYAFDGVSSFHLAVPQLVFGEVAGQGLAPWETVVFTDVDGAGGDRGVVRSAEGLVLGGLRGVDVVDTADVVVIPSWFDDLRPAGASMRALLQHCRDRGVLVVGLCLGAFPLADAGLLDGRRAVTHWKATAHLAARRPAVQVEADLLYIDLVDVLTSAGTASGIDACLHLVRARLGAEAANAVARSLVVAPHRDGGQAQYVDQVVPPRRDDDPVSAVLQWALEHLAEPLTLDVLAGVAQVSRRTFVRRFRASTGTTPAVWVRHQRLDEARRLLEHSDLTVDQVARRCGFGSTVTFRQGFADAFATTPSAYRRRFDTRFDTRAARAG